MTKKIVYQEAKGGGKRSAQALAIRVYALRTEQKLSQDALAAKAKIGANAVPRIEDMLVDPKLSTIEAIAHALGVEASDLLK